MKTTSLYDFTLTANGTFVVLADANFYKVLTSTGDIQVTRDGGATIKPLRAGRGERNVPFQRLTIKDISGAPNSGTILVGDSDFIDDTIVISSAINVRPEPHSGYVNNISALAANTAEVIFSAASNTGGAILMACGASDFQGAGDIMVLAKATAPASVADGVPYAQFPLINSSSGAYGVTAGQSYKEQQIPAGLGLYFIGNALGSAAQHRWARYKLL